MITKEYDYIVIGGGSGGLLVAVGLQNAGKNFALISENIGGDCTHFGCVPSKTFLHLAKKYKSTGDLNIRDTVFGDVKNTVEHFVNEEKTIINPETYIAGTAEFENENAISVTLRNSGEKQLLKFKKGCIIATGSSPRNIEIKGVSKEKVINNEDFFYLEKLPKSITIIGGGPIGAEIATGCASFDITTYLVAPEYLPREPQNISEKSLKSLQDQKVKYISSSIDFVDNAGAHLANGSTLPTTDYYLTAIGRVPNVSLSLEQAGVKYEKNGIVVSKNLQTTNKKIWAIGDCVQGPQFTHLAASHGKYVLKRILVPLGISKKQLALPRVTFTAPAISSVGDFSNEDGFLILSLEFSILDKGITNSDLGSYGEICINTKTGKIKGVSIFGDFGEELISLFTLAIDKGVSVLELGNLITPYPTYSNILHSISLKYLNYLIANWKKNPVITLRQFIKYIF